MKNGTVINRIQNSMAYYDRSAIAELVGKALHEMGTNVKHTRLLEVAARMQGYPTLHHALAHDKQVQAEREQARAEKERATTYFLVELIANEGSAPNEKFVAEVLGWQDSILSEYGRGRVGSALLYPISYDRSDEIADAQINKIVGPIRPSLDGLKGFEKIDGSAARQLIQEGLPVHEFDFSTGDLGPKVAAKVVQGWWDDDGIKFDAGEWFSGTSDEELLVFLSEDPEHAEKRAELRDSLGRFAATQSEEVAELFAEDGLKDGYVSYDRYYLKSWMKHSRPTLFERVYSAK